MPRILYHHSPVSNRESILREGLDPSYTVADARPAIWLDTQYTKPEEDEDNFQSELVDVWQVDMSGLEDQLVDDVFSDPETGEDDPSAPMNEGVWFKYVGGVIPPDRLTLIYTEKPAGQGGWKQAKADPPDWKKKFLYRKANGKEKCATCDAFASGRCSMFDDEVEPAMTCDEWTNTPTWRLGSAEDEEEQPEEPIWNITNGDEVLQGRALDPDDPDPHLFQWVPPTRTYDLDEALTDLREGGYHWSVERGDEPQMWRLQHKREPVSHDISSRDLQLRGYNVYYNDDYLPGKEFHPHYHLHDTTDPSRGPGRIWATQRVDDLEDWQEPEPGALNEPFLRERSPDFWRKHWGSVDAALTHPGVPFETYARFVLKSQWSDIQAKAKRLILEGKVTILVNTPTAIIAHVIGDGSDNGGTPDEHEVEIAREDPDSNVITQSVCDCKWQQYRWDRTRKWEKFEGRVCSHILAAFWKAKSVPIDITDLDAGTEYKTPVGQKGPMAQPGQTQMPLPKPTPMMQNPIETPQPSAPPLPSKTDMVGGPPSNPFAPPKAPQRSPKVPQREQLELFNLSPDPNVQSAPPAGGFSQPGQTPPDPESVQLPGTFSHWHQADGTVHQFAPRPGMRFDRNNVEFEVVGRSASEIFYTEAGKGGQIFSMPIPQWQQEQQSGLIYRTARTSMAERTGDPELDALIEEFRRGDYSQEHYDDEPQWQSIERLRDPNVAEGLCVDLAEQFAGFLTNRGIFAQTAQGERGDDVLFSEFYPDTKADPRSEVHDVTIVDKDGHRYMVDWTAAQYGLKDEFPMVQRLDESGWQREWTAAPSYFSHNDYDPATQTFKDGTKYEGPGELQTGAIHRYHAPEDENWDYDEEGRAPFLYHVPSDQLFIGYPGDHHGLVHVQYMWPQFGDSIPHYNEMVEGDYYPQGMLRYGVPARWNIVQKGDGAGGSDAMPTTPEIDQKLTVKLQGYDPLAVHGDEGTLAEAPDPKDEWTPGQSQ